MTILLWLILWITVLGLPNYLFKKHQITYYRFPVAHCLWYVGAIVATFLIYSQELGLYFDGNLLSTIPYLLGMFALWMLVPLLYPRDYFSNKKERLSYQAPKFFEVLFQQVGFLAGLLTFNVSPFVFTGVFFLLHIPIALFIPRKFAFIFTGASLIGGIMFATLQSLGFEGFLISLAVHLSFYLILHRILCSKKYIEHSAHKR